MFNIGSSNLMEPHAINAQSPYTKHDVYPISLIHKALNLKLINYYFNRHRTTH